MLTQLSEKPEQMHHCTLPWIESTHLIPMPFIRTVCVHYQPIDRQNILNKFCKLPIPKSLKADFIQFSDEIMQTILSHQLSLLPYTSKICYEILFDVLKNGVNAMNILYIQREPEMKILTIRRLAVDPNPHFLRFIGEIDNHMMNDINEVVQNTDA